MHLDKSFDVNGTWQRWKRYDLVNGVIVPAPGSPRPKKYDPWDQFRANAGKYRTVAQPYLPLLELNRNLQKAKSEGIRPSDPGYHPRHLAQPIVGPKTDADRLILDWCNAHGLLGLVSVLSDSIRLSQTFSHFRRGGQWFTRSESVDAGVTQRRVETGRRSSQPRVRNNAKQSVTWLNWMFQDYEEKNIDHLELYFRPVWKEGQPPLSVPRPNSQEFWNQYGEPIREFAYWCEVFGLSVDYMSQWEPTKAEDESAKYAVMQSHWLLTGLAQSAETSFRFRPERNQLDEARVSAGLLGSYALMFLWDRADGRRALRCQNCDRYFISDEQRALYCSPKCRNTAQSRRYRRTLRHLPPQAQRSS
jgi:hypothetical protein